MKKRGEIPVLVGNTAILAIDMFEGCIADTSCNSGIPIMTGAMQRMQKAAEVVKAGRKAGMPIIVIQEIHRKTHVDFGRELDGSEGIHCIEGSDGVKPPIKELDMTEDDMIVIKRRYSAFFMTDLELLLKAHKIETLILVGSLTDVCIHYTFVDGHQYNYYCRAVEDCIYGGSTEAHNASVVAMNYLQSDGVQSYDEIMEAIKNYSNRESSK